MKICVSDWLELEGNHIEILPDQDSELGLDILIDGYELSHVVSTDSLSKHAFSLYCKRSNEAMLLLAAGEDELSTDIQCLTHQNGRTTVDYERLMITHRHRGKLIIQSLWRPDESV